MMNSQRKYSWLGNAIWFNLCKILYKRDPALWVFGALEGKKYDDNAKYLFEHVNASHAREIRSVWLAGTEKVVNDIRLTGGEAYTFDSTEGKRIARRAGVAIYTHALVDFGLWPQVGGATIVFLGHGVGFKQTYNAKRKGLSLLLKSVFDKAFSWIQRDITIATSEFNKAERMKIAGLKDDSGVFITGQPRNDALAKNVDRDKILNSIGIEKGKRIALYMPTYRRSVNGKNMIEPIIRQLYESQELDKTLNDEGYVFVAKLHPLTPYIDIPRRNNFVILDYQAIKATQELQIVSDILITDFSSCCVDFALTDKPVVFYLPDKEWFVNNSEQVCKEFYSICNKNQCVSPDSLAAKIKHPTIEATQAINDLFEDASIKGTCYSENVYCTIKKFLEL